MYLYCFIVFFAFSIFAGSVYGETLEAIRQQFEIYQRYSGEMEVLLTDNVKEIDNVLKRTETKRLTVRKELDEVQSVTKPKKGLPFPLFFEGYAAPFIHYVTVERAFAKRSLQQDKSDDTMQSIQYVYYLADELSESGSLELRTVAALIRLQILETVQSLLSNPFCRHEHHELLYKIFDDRVNRGTTDKIIWTRYREEGKRFFEEVARNGFDKTVAPSLLKELQDRHAFDEYEKATVERFSHDQSVFLRVMEAIIESCTLPFYQRQPALRQLNKELRERQGTTTEPVFAILLLRDVTESMRLFAQEQSGNEMAYLALSVSLHGRNRRKTINYLTGNEYEIRLITDGVMCTYKENVKPFYVPYRKITSLPFVQ